MLTPFDTHGTLYKGNLHGHSTASDGLIAPADACAAYRAHGYDFTVISDHFLDTYDFPVTDTRAFRTERFTTLIGAELHAPETSRGEQWHILAVGLPLDFAPPGATETGPEIGMRAREAGAFVVLAHPQWYQLQVSDGLALDAAHAVEIYNHTSLVHADAGDGLVMLDALLSEGRRLNAIATDDSHWRNGDAFGGWVMVRASENTPDALQKALLSGAYYATQGPEIHHLELKRNTLYFRTSPVKAVMLTGPGARHRAVHAQKTPLTEGELALTAFCGRWCRLAIADYCGRRAWSNPLWLD